MDGLFAALLKTAVLRTTSLPSVTLPDHLDGEQGGDGGRGGRGQRGGGRRLQPGDGRRWGAATSNNCDMDEDTRYYILPCDCWQAGSTASPPPAPRSRAARCPSPSPSPSRPPPRRRCGATRWAARGGRSPSRTRTSGTGTTTSSSRRCLGTRRPATSRHTCNRCLTIKGKDSTMQAFSEYFYLHPAHCHCQTSLTRLNPGGQLQLPHRDFRGLHPSAAARGMSPPDSLHSSNYH